MNPGKPPDDFLPTGGAMDNGLGESALAGGEGLKPGSMVGTVRIEHRLGIGGMGAVYLGVDDRGHAKLPGNRGQVAGRRADVGDHGVGMRN